MATAQCDQFEFVAPQPGEVRVYLARPDPLIMRTEDGLAAMLEEAERERGARLVRPQDRTAHRLAHALLQRALRGALERDSCPLVRDAHGRPSLAQPPAQPLWFNLSHTTGMVACALARVPVGIDVEGIVDDRDWRGIAMRFFHPDELAWIESATVSQKRTRFTRVWTLKEAVVKAAGRGLSIPLDGFAVDPDKANSAIRSEDPNLSGAWWLAERAYPSHQLGLAVRTRERMAVTWIDCTAQQVAAVDQAAQPDRGVNWTLGREEVA
jgi:4'-phosphopantetheinyl transferase